MPTLYRVETHWNGLGGGPGLTVTHFTAGGGAADDAAAAVAQFWTATNDQRVSSAQWTIGAEVFLIESDDGEILGTSSVVPQTGVGTVLGDLLPGQCQGLLRLATGVYLDGRRLQGRVFLPGAGEAQSAPGGTPSTACIADYNAAAATLVGDADSALVVWKRPQPATDEHPFRLGQFAVVNGATMKGSWATLRGRAIP